MGGIVVNTNLSSLMVQRNLTKATDDMNIYMKRLSTGLRINDSGDDAAGLALSEKLKAHVNSSTVAKNNALTGINMLQIAEGDLGTIQDSLQRMRDLAVQAANGVYSTSERRALNKEFQERIEEIDRVAMSSAFSDLNLLDGSITASGGEMRLQISTGAEASTNTLNISDAFNKADASALGVGGTSQQTITSVTGSRDAISAIDSAINNISDRRSTIGATTNRLDSTIQRIDIRKENLQASYSIIRDADIATESANLTKAQILQQASASLLQQANQTPSIALSLIA